MNKKNLVVITILFAAIFLAGISIRGNREATPDFEEPGETEETIPENLLADVERAVWDLEEEIHGLEIEMDEEEFEELYQELIYLDSKFYEIEEDYFSKNIGEEELRNKLDEVLMEVERLKDKVKELEDR